MLTVFSSQNRHHIFRISIIMAARRWGISAPTLLSSWIFFTCNKPRVEPHNPIGEFLNPVCSNCPRGQTSPNPKIPRSHTSDVGNHSVRRAESSGFFLFSFPCSLFFVSFFLSFFPRYTYTVLPTTRETENGQREIANPSESMSWQTVMDPAVVCMCIDG